MPYSRKFSFLLTQSQFRATRPPPLVSRLYGKDYNEVNARGSLNSSVRSAAQTQLAYFWSDNFFALWNRALRGIADTELDDMGDTARLFPLAWLAAADSFICTWETKRHYAFWRPVTAIHEGDNDGNRKTSGDPDWRPFLNNPNYPDHSSGANAITGSITHMLKLVFGTDRVTFSLTSSVALANPNVRTYRKFSLMQPPMVSTPMAAMPMPGRYDSTLYVSSISWSMASQVRCHACSGAPDQ